VALQERHPLLACLICHPSCCPAFALQERYPLLVCLIYQSHSLALVLKHWAKVKHCEHVAAWFESLNLMINCILENTRIKWLVNQKQKEIYGKVRWALTLAGVLGS
jgi:hypothetical protein